MKFNEAINFDSVMIDIKKYIDNMTEISEKEQVILDNIKFLRNEENKDFVLWYWLLVDGSKDRQVQFLIRELIKLKHKLTDPESIRRAKQLLVAKMPERYGELDPKVLKEKETKQVAIMEFVTQ